MNYIQRLQEELKEEKEKREEIEEKIAELVRYVNLPKFKHGELENYVNVKDILIRLL